MKEWLEIRDFSQGMNRQDAISAGDAPWDLQDALLSEKPELRRRGPYTNRYIDLSATDAKNRVRGTVLAASRYHFTGIDSVITVSYRTAEELGNATGMTYIEITRRGEAPELVKSIQSTASSADICGAWTDADDSTKQDLRPDAVLITTDVGAWVLSFDGSPSNIDEDIYTVARTTTDGGDLGGGGFRACASVNGYSFLGGRIAGGEDTKYKKAAGRRLWWSKLQNSEVWTETTNLNYPARGGSETLPITEGIKAMEELNGNLIVFTRGQIHALTISSDPNNWDRQQRASVGTTFPKSVAKYEGTLIFANKDAVYRFDGYDVVNMTEDAIGEFYRSKFYQEVLAADDDENPAQGKVVGSVIGDYYILTLSEDSGEAFCCHIPTGSWTRFSNIPLLAQSQGPAEDYRTFGFVPTTSGGTTYSRIIRLDRMFVPDASGLDSFVAAESSQGPELQIELRRTSGEGIAYPKLWRSVSVLYDAKDQDDGTLDIAYAASPDKDDETWVDLEALPPTPSGMSQARRTIAATSPAIGIKITENGYGDLGKTAIASVEIGFKRLRRGRA